MAQRIGSKIEEKKADEKSSSTTNSKKPDFQSNFANKYYTNDSVPSQPMKVQEPSPVSEVLVNSFKNETEQDQSMFYGDIEKIDEVDEIEDDTFME